MNYRNSLLKNIRLKKYDNSRKSWWGYKAMYNWNPRCHMTTFEVSRPKYEISTRISVVVRRRSGLSKTIKYVENGFPKLFRNKSHNLKMYITLL